MPEYAEFRTSHDDRRAIVDLMWRLKNMSDDDYLRYFIAYHAAPTIQGIKPATLACPDAAGRCLADALARLGPELSRIFGVEVADFRNPRGAMLLLVYDSTHVCRTLADGEAAALLREEGYGVPETGVYAMLARLRERCAGRRFPHEIGVFLGYPPGDVRSFMSGRDAGRREGCAWRCYGDIEEARNISGRFRRAKRIAAELIVAGADLGGVAVGLGLDQARMSA